MASLASLPAGMSLRQLLLLKDENHDTQVYVYAILFTILTIITTDMRVTARHLKKVAVGIDSVLIILSLVGYPLFHYKARPNTQRYTWWIGDYYSTNDIYLRW